MTAESGGCRDGGVFNEIEYPWPSCSCVFHCLCRFSMWAAELNSWVVFRDSKNVKLETRSISSSHAFLLERPAQPICCLCLNKVHYINMQCTIMTPTCFSESNCYSRCAQRCRRVSESVLDLISREPCCSRAPRAAHLLSLPKQSALHQYAMYIHDAYMFLRI